MKKTWQSILIVSILLLFIIVFIGANMRLTLLYLDSSLPAWPLWTAYLFLGFSYGVSWILPRGRLSKWLGSIGSHYMPVFLLLFAASVFNTAGYLLAVVLFRWLSPAQYAYIALAIFALTGALCLYGIVHAHRQHVVRYTLSVQKEAGKLKSLHIVHLSDLHLGPVNDLHAIEKMLQKVRALDPDVVCITGDTFTENVHEVFEMDAIAAAFAALRPRYGVYTCLGNHDAGSALPQMMAFFRAANIQVLQDAHVLLDGSVALVGRSDLSPAEHFNEQRPSVADCLREIDPTLPCIVLDHQPAQVAEAAAAGVDLLLCGHTHGGQFFPVQLLIRRRFPFYTGYRRFGQMHAIISPGSGTGSPPMRIGSDGQIIDIRLRFDEEDMDQETNVTPAVNNRPIKSSK